MSKQENPYLDGRREWNERYGDYIKQAHSWKVIAITSLLISVIGILGIVGLSLQKKVVPYVVEVDRSGVAIAINRADQSKSVSPRIIKALLARWVIDFRNITVDATAQKQAINQVYSFLAQGDPATTAINEHFQTKGNPFDRAQREIVSVEISSVLAISDKSWQIEWIETIRNRQGAIQGEPQRMKAVATIAIVPPNNEKTILKNPIGLYIKQINWTKQF